MTKRASDDRSRAVRDARANRQAWDADSDEYQEQHRTDLTGDKALAWGIWRIPERELNVLGKVTGLRILELGCGAAQWSIGLVKRRAKAIGLDGSSRQLLHAQEGARAARVKLPLLQADAAFLPLRDESFDIVFCDYGAMSFADPMLTVPEVARVLRPGGLLAFSTTTPFLQMCWPDGAEKPDETLHSSYFDLHRAEWSADDTVDFTLPYGGWIRLFRSNDLVVEDLIEIRPHARARTTYPGRPLLWARRWPAEMIWKVRKSG
jgi:SAM-dependent methyltransferase